MLTFADFAIGMERFGTRIQPLMKCRSHIMPAEAARGGRPLSADRRPSA